MHTLGLKISCREYLATVSKWREIGSCRKNELIFFLLKNILRVTKKYMIESIVFLQNTVTIRLGLRFAATHLAWSALFLTFCNMIRMLEILTFNQNF